MKCAECGRQRQRWAENKCRPCYERDRPPFEDCARVLHFEGWAEAAEFYSRPRSGAEERRTRELEAEGLTRSDAQGVVEAEALKRTRVNK